jgi:hypothetical protein
MLQGRMVGGAIATLLWSGRTTASSRTTSEAPHLPGPVIGGNEGATASASVRRNRHAEGAGASGVSGVSLKIIGAA